MAKLVNNLGKAIFQVIKTLLGFKLAKYVSFSPSSYAVQVVLISLAISCVSFLSQIVVARNMNPKDFATFASIAAAMNISGVLFSSILMNQVKTIRVSLSELTRAFLDRGMKEVFLLSIFVSGIFLSVLTLRNTGTPVLTILISGLIFPIVALVTGLNAKFQGLGKLRSLNLSTFTTVLLSLFGQGFLLLTGDFSVNNALIVILVSNLITLIAFSRKLPPAGLPNSSIFSSSGIQLALLSSGFWFFVNSDILFSPLWLGDEDRGEYSAASAVAKISIIACGVLNGLFLNSLLDHKKRSNVFPLGLFGKYLLIEGVVVLAFEIGIFLFGDDAFKIVFGSHLTSDHGFLLKICLAAVPCILIGLLVQILISHINSWFPVILMWTLCLFFVVIGSRVGTKQDLVNLYTVSGLIVFVVLSVAVADIYRTLKRG